MEGQAKAKAMNAVFTDALASRRRWYDDNGFLHISLRFMRTGTLQYQNTPETFPNGVPPHAVDHRGVVTVMVEPSDLGESESLASLAGLPCLRTHDWASPDKDLDQTGSVAGVPEFDGEYVIGEAVITDAETIRRIESGVLVEVSAAYVHEIDWTPGEHQGEPYAGKQRRIRYNHFVLLEEGEGRAGSAVRVTNSKEKEDMSEPNKEGGILVWLKSLGGKPVRVMNADDAEKVAEVDAKAENESPEESGGEPAAVDLPTPEEIQGMKDKLAAMTTQIEELTAQRDELLAAATGDSIEAAADEIAAERDEVAEVMNSNGFDKAQAMNAFKEQRLRGSALKVFAMNSIREKAGRERIGEEEAKNEAIVDGMWKVTKEYATNQKHPVGAFQAPKAQNSNDRETMRNNQLRAISPRFAKGAK